MSSTLDDVNRITLEEIERGDAMAITHYLSLSKKQRKYRRGLRKDYGGRMIEELDRFMRRRNMELYFKSKRQRREKRNPK